MKKLSFEQMETVEGGKFWGTIIEDCGDCRDGLMICTSTSYYFWIPIINEPKAYSCV